MPYHSLELPFLSSPCLKHQPVWFEVSTVFRFKRGLEDLTEFCICRQQQSTSTSNAGAALGAVLPSAGSMQQMVGLTLLAGMPSVASPVPRRNRGKSRSTQVHSLGQLV